MKNLRVKKDNQGRKLSFKVLQRNVYFANPENMLLAMLVDDKEEVCNKALMQILTIRKIKSTRNNGSKSGERPTTSDNFIRRFFILSINFEATRYNEMANNLSASTEEPQLQTLQITIW